MIMLSDEQLALILPGLKSDIPRSLLVYHMVRNTCRKKYCWPAVEFIVDRFPDFSVCLVQPKINDKAFVPFLNGYHIFVYSKTDADQNIVRKMLYQDQVVDWTQSYLMIAVTEPEHLLVLNEGPKLVGGLFEDCDVDAEGQPIGPHCFYFDLPKLDLSYTVPKGLRAGILLPDHASQMSVDRTYGMPSITAKYFRCMLSNSFPSFALFPDQSDTPIAYIVYKCDGTLGAAFVHPDYRQRGLYKLILRGMLQKLRDLGEVHVWAEAAKSNPISARGLLSVGGVEFVGRSVTHFIDIWPRGKSV